jgi:DNA-binding response OmpR family regulator
MVATGSVERVGQCQFDLLGVNDFVAKPVPIRELARRLEVMIRRD